MAGYVYRLFDRHKRLLYVGSTNNIARRVSEHARRSRWFADADDIDVVTVPNIDDARYVESEFIRLERPIHNIQHQDRRPDWVWFSPAELRDVLAGLEAKRDRLSRRMERLDAEIEHATDLLDRATERAS